MPQPESTSKLVPTIGLTGASSRSHKHATRTGTHLQHAPAPTAATIAAASAHEDPRSRTSRMKLPTAVQQVIVKHYIADAVAALNGALLTTIQSADISNDQSDTMQLHLDAMERIDQACNPTQNGGCGVCGTPLDVAFTADFDFSSDADILEDPHPCKECNHLVCEECVSQCDKCSKITCWECDILCEFCDATACRDGCGDNVNQPESCVECEDWACGDCAERHVSACANCDTPVCIDCREECCVNDTANPNPVRRPFVICIYGVLSLPSKHT